MKEFFIVSCLVYNLALMGLFAYLVTVHDWSAWWFLAVLALHASVTKE